MRLQPIVLLCLVFFESSWCLAVLGEDEASVEKTRSQLQGKRKKNASVLRVDSSAQASSYTVQEMTTDTATIKEYLGKDGIIFAVTWQGIKAPDLAVLFGSYYAEYDSVTANSKHEPGHRNHAAHHTSKITVQRFGHMGDLRGRAYLPKRLPEGVKVDELQ